MSKTPKSSFSLQNLNFRFKFFFDQNLDFVLGNSRLSAMTGGGNSPCALSSRGSTFASGSPSHKKQKKPKENIFEKPEEKERKRRMLSDMELDICIKSLKNNSNYFRQYVNTKSEEELASISTSHNHFLRDKGWTKIMERPDPNGWKDLAPKYSWQKKSKRPPMSDPWNAIPGKFYLPPGHVQVTADDRTAFVRKPSRQDDELKRVKWRGWPELKPKRKADVATDGLKQMFEYGDVVPVDLGDRGTLLESQVTALSKRNYDKDLIKHGVELARFMQLEGHEVTKGFIQMDYNNSKSVSFSEFQSYCKKIRFPGDFKSVFMLLDVRAKGWLTKKTWNVICEFQDLVKEADLERDKAETDAENKRIKGKERKRRQMEASADEFRDQITAILASLRSPRKKN